MAETVTIVFFDGQFWKAIIERIDDSGGVAIGTHVFGAEPTNPELVRFALDGLDRVPAYRSDALARRKARRSISEETRRTNKSRAAYGALLAASLEARKKERSALLAVEDAARYEARLEKRKKRRRGH